MSTRRLGLSFVGALLAVGGAASLWRSTYLAMPAWRRSIAWGAVMLGGLLLLGALRRNRAR